MDQTESPEPVNPPFPVHELNESLSLLCQKCAAHLAVYRQIGGSYQMAEVYSMVIHHCLQAQSAIESIRRRA